MGNLETGRAAKEATAIYSHYREEIERCCRHWAFRLADRHERDEIYSDALTVTWNSLRKRCARGLHPLPTYWIFCRNAVRNALRGWGMGWVSDRRYFTRPDWLPPHSIPADDETGAPSASSRKWTPADETRFKLDLEAALAQLSEPARRIVLLLRDGWTRQDAARALGMSRDALADRLAVALPLLAGLLEV